MRKEIFFAILAGGAFGLLIAYGAWKLNSSIKSKNADVISTSSTPSETSTPQTSTGEFKILITKPTNMSVLTVTPTIVTGVTNPGSIVSISGEDNDEIITASDSGSFEANLDLEGGANQIKLTAFANDGAETNFNLMTIFSGQFQGENATSYLGVVTDISNSIIQIKNSDGEIQQVATKEGTAYVKIANNTNKIITATDLAIGDYLIAMGTKNANSILDASRVLVSDQVTPTTRRAFYGVVTDDSGFNKFVAKNPKTNESVTITPGTGISVNGNESSFGKIANNEKVIAVGEFKDGTITARTIKVLK